MNSTAIHHARVCQARATPSPKRPRFRCARESHSRSHTVELVDRVRDERPRAADGDGAGALGEPAPPLVVTPQWWNPDEFEASRTGEG